MYDVIVVGARVAGSPLAMLLARKGYGKLVVTGARALSQRRDLHAWHPAGRHRQAQPVGPARQDPRIRRADDRAFRRSTPKTGRRWSRRRTGMSWTTSSYSPRRYLLDRSCSTRRSRWARRCARSSQSMISCSTAERVVGVRGHARHGLTVEERARIVVADGKRLFVARRVGAWSVSRARADDDGVLLVLQRYRSDRHGPVRRYGRGGLRLADNDGLSIKGIMRPGRDKAWYRDDIEANMMSDFEMVMPSGRMIRAGRREERISGPARHAQLLQAGVRSRLVLAGDAGHTKDPITAFGITDAFRAADAVAEAIDEGLSGRRPLDEALADYQHADEKAGRCTRSHRSSRRSRTA